MIPVLLTTALALAAPDVRTVAVGLPPEGASALAAVLEETLAAFAPGVEWRFDAVPPERLSEVLAAPPGDHRVVAAVAYPLPVLRELDLAGRFVPRPPCPTHREGAGASKGACALWFDPILLAWSDGGTGVSGRPSWVPERLADLCEGGVDGRLLLQRAAVWNATGALVTSLAEAGGTPSEADERLIGLDGNRAAPYLEREEAVLRRLASLEPSPVAVVSRSGLARFRAEHAAEAVRLHAVAPSDRAAAILLGAAALDARGAAPLFEVLGAPAALAEVSRAIALLPLSDRVGDALLPGDGAALRVVLNGEGPRLAREAALARTTVDRYLDEIVGRHEGREALFSEVFDAIGIAAMVALVIWALRRRDGGSLVVGGPRSTS
ncbi:MAG: hypothetical protein ACF8XB_13070 [Planctomycetota bacterium JB042]